MKDTNGNGNGDTVVIDEGERENLITDGDIEKLLTLIGAELRKSGLDSSAIKKVLRFHQISIQKDIVQVIARYQSLFRGFVERSVTMGVGHLPMQAIKATQRKLFLNESLIKSIPKSGAGIRKVTFFHLGRTIGNDALSHEFDIRGLRPDPIAQCMVNQEDPEFADFNPNCTIWKNEGGEWCYLAFNTLNFNLRRVYLARSIAPWNAEWWYGGVPI
jgi:hypothetical protein